MDSVSFRPNYSRVVSGMFPLRHRTYSTAASARVRIRKIVYLDGIDVLLKIIKGIVQLIILAPLDIRGGRSVSLHLDKPSCPSPRL